MDAAYIATVDSREQTIEVMVGATNAEALVEGAVIPVDQTYCARMLTGEIPNIVPDVSAEPGLRDVTVIRDIGSYIGVPGQAVRRSRARIVVLREQRAAARPRRARAPVHGGARRDRRSAPGPRARKHGSAREAIRAV